MRGLDDLATFWILLARLGMRTGQWLNTAEALSYALHLNRSEVESSTVFLHFLACTGQPRTAVRLPLERTLQ